MAATHQESAAYHIFLCDLPTITKEQDADVLPDTKINDLYADIRYQQRTMYCIVGLVSAAVLAAFMYPFITQS